MKIMGTKTSNDWVSALKEEGYNHNFTSCSDLKRLSRVWKKILSSIGRNNKSDVLSFFDVGFGGGKHVAMLALNGHECAGIDVSKEVASRAKMYIDEIEQKCCELNIELIIGSIFDFNDEHIYDNKYDVVYHFGVIEHFLDSIDRIVFLQKMFELTKPGGYVVSVVPSGIHPVRKRQKEFNLGGYVIPEIDYSDTLMKEEFEEVGLKNTIVLPHNIFSYLMFFRKNKIIYFFGKLFFLIAQLVPLNFLPSKFNFKHAGTLIAIGQKKI
jgi:2-polyprenyl-3-methyl-5-hydroxy-6-metoxy-1,4-benzoquinol methylase